MITPEIAASFRGRSVVVTGGTGMIGRQIVTQLCDMGAQVTTLSLDRLQADPRAPHVYGDLADITFCKAQTKGARLQLRSCIRALAVAMDNPPNSRLRMAD